MKTGLILTMGLSPDPLIFTIKKFNASLVYFIGTSDSFRQSLDKVIEDCSLKPSKFDRFPIEDNPSNIGVICEYFMKARDWLIEQGAEEIIADLTGGRKWMSAGGVMAASFLGIRMIYVDARYESGKVVKQSMECVELGNAYDQSGFILSGKARDAYHSFQFENAAIQFERIKPTNAHKSVFFSALSDICHVLAKWDRFQHYAEGISIELEQALDSLYASLNSGAGNYNMRIFAEALQLFNSHLKTNEGTNTLNLSFLVDLLLNAERCIIRGRYDDAIGRQYRILEATSQYFLKQFGIETDKPDYKQLTEAQKDLFLNPINPQGNLPEYIDLRIGFWLLNVMGHPIGEMVFVNGQYKNFKFLKILSERNYSILAHGFKSIGKEKTEQFQIQLENLLSNILGEEFFRIKRILSLPTMPEIGF